MQGASIAVLAVNPWKDETRPMIMMFSQWSEEGGGAMQITKSMRHGNHQVAPTSPRGSGLESASRKRYFVASCRSG